MFNWLKQATGAVGNAFNQGASFVARNNPVSQSYNAASRAAAEAQRRLREQQMAQQQAQRQIAQQAQINAQRLQRAVPKLNMGAAMNALGKVGMAANPVNQFKFQTNQIKSAPKVVDQLTDTFARDLKSLGYSIADVGARSAGVTAQLQAPIVKPFLNEAGRRRADQNIQNTFIRANQFQRKGLDPLGKVAKGDTGEFVKTLGTKGVGAGLEVAPVVTGMSAAVPLKTLLLKSGTLGGLGNLTYSGVSGQYSNSRSAQDKALQAALDVGSAFGGELIGRGIGKVISKIATPSAISNAAKAVQDLNAPQVAKNLADKGRLLSQGYTNVKVGKIAPQDVTSKLTGSAPANTVQSGKAYTQNLVDNAAQQFRAGKIDEKQLRALLVDNYEQTFKKMPMPADIDGYVDGIKGVTGRPYVEMLRAKTQAAAGGVVPQTPIKVGSIAETAPKPLSLHPEDQRVMMDFIEFNKGKYFPDPTTKHELQIAASRILEHYDLPHPRGKAVKSTGDMANAFQHALEQTDVPGKAPIKFKTYAENAPAPVPKTYQIPTTNKTDVTKLSDRDLQYFAKQGFTEVKDNLGNTRQIIKLKPETLDSRIAPHKLDNDIVYHGTSSDNTQSILNGGFKSGSELPESAFRGGGHGELGQKSISFSTSPKQASVFGATAGRGSVIEAKLRPNSNVVTVRGIDYAEDLNKIIPSLKKKGIDAVYLPGEQEVVVINKGAIKATGKYQDFKATDAKNTNFFGEKPNITKPIYELAPKPDKPEDLLKKAGYKLNKDGDWIDPKGKPADIGEMQQVIQPKKLTQDEALVNQGKMNYAQAEADTKSLGAPIYETAPLPNKTAGLRTGLSKSLEKKGFKSELYDDIPGYTKIENKTLVDNSLSRIEKNESEVMRAILNRKRNTPITAQMNSDAITLMNKLAREGRDDELGKLAKATAMNATEAGRAVQILSRLQALTPEGALTRAQNIIAKYNDKFAKNNKDLVLTKENQSTIIKMAKGIQKLEDGTREHDVASAMLAKYIDSLVPPSKLAKISSLQTMAQLLNPKTAIRNIVGNAAMSVGEDVSTSAAAPVDMLISGLQRLTGHKSQRTVGMINPWNRLKGTAQGAVWGTQDALKGIKTSGLAGNFEITTNVFRGAQKGDNIIKAAARDGMNGAQTLLSLELGAADKAFYTGQFKTSLGSMMRASKVKKPEKWMLQQADAEALYSTFQNNSKIAQGLSGTKKWLNAQKEWGLGDIIVKYPKTPGNIVSVGLDYSPVGALKGIYSLVSNWGRLDKVTQREAARNIGRSIVGTGAIGLGAMLAYNKIITGKKSSDRDMAAVDRQQGEGPFTFNFTALQRLISGGSTEPQKGDVIANYDWMQPSAIALSMGANAVLNGGAKQRKWENVFGDALEAVGDSVNTVVEQPVLTGISRFINTASSPDRGGGFGPAFANLFQGVPSSFVPGLLNQVGQLTDNVSRSTYDPDYIKTGINQVKARIPGLRETLQPRVDSLGNQQEQYADGGNNAFNVFFNPAFVRTFKTSPAYDLINSIFKNTGDTQQAPRVTKNEVTINGEKRSLTAEESTRYQQYVGQLTKETFTKMGTDPKFLALPDSEKASRMASAMTDANQAALYELFGNRSKTGDNTARRIANSGQVGYSAYADPATGARTYKEKYEQELANYNQDKNDGVLSDVGDIKKSKELKKLKVQADFSQDTNDLYSLSNKEIDAYLSNKPNGGGMFNQLLALDDKLVSQGFSSKFRDKYGKLKNMNADKYGGKGKKAKIAKSKMPKFKSVRIARGSAPKISKTPRLKLRSYT